MSESSGAGEWSMFAMLTFFMVVAAIMVPAIQGEFGYTSDVPNEFNPSDISKTSLLSIGGSLWSMFSPVWSYFTLFPDWVILIHFVIKILWYILLLRLIILPIVQAVGEWIPFT